MPPSPSPPKQARSRRTLERIVLAADALFSERGVDDVTVLEIVERARSSVGSFYARFPGKDDLVRYLETRGRGEALAAWEEALAAPEWERLSLGETVEALVGALVSLCRGDSAWRRAFLGDGPPQPGGDGAAGRRELQERILADFRRLLSGRGREITHRDPESAVRIGYRILIGGVRELAAEGFSDERASRELSRSLLAYLGGRAPAEDDLVMDDPFNIWG